jgi:uncharacterized protein (TIGR02246 family)
MLDRPEDIAAAFAAAWNVRDADAIAALFEDDAEFVNVVGCGGTTARRSAVHKTTLQHARQ